MRERDTQRARVYKSDAALTAIAAPLPSVRDVERFVKRVFGMKRVNEAFPRSARYLTPKVKDGRGRRKACGWSGGIAIPLWARNEAIVLHELAHTVCHREYPVHTAAHGWQYCSIYLTLVLYAMGREAHDTLKAAFKKNRVKFTAPRKRRELTPEQKAELRLRLAHARAARLPSVSPAVLADFTRLIGQ